MTHNDIYFIIEGSHFWGGIMKVVILSISQVETVFYLQRSYCSGSENKKKKTDSVCTCQ